MKTLDWQLVEVNHVWEVRTPNHLGVCIGSGYSKQAALNDAISRLKATTERLLAKLRKELA